jgi:hypothetical protein
MQYYPYWHQVSHVKNVYYINGIRTMTMTELVEVNLVLTGTRTQLAM